MVITYSSDLVTKPTGVYTQTSCADPLAPTWAVSTAGQMELVPNLEAEWVLDDETLLQCQHFAGGETKQSSLAESTGRTKALQHTNSEGSVHI